MTRVVRLLTVVDVDDRAHVEDPRQLSVSALHLAVLDDGRRVTLLDDRGWSTRGPSGGSRRMPIEALEADARTVVGPDEPYGSRTPDDMEADHWAHLAGVLARHGVPIDAARLRRTSHDVEVSPRVLSRVTG